MAIASREMTSYLWLVRILKALIFVSYRFYQVIEIAKEVTGINSATEAIRVFRRKLNSTESFFNDAPIPRNESGKEAHKKCSNLKGAKKYCPKRWAAMQLWFKEARTVSLIELKLQNTFSMCLLA